MPRWTIWLALWLPTAFATIGLVWGFAIALLWRGGFAGTTMAMGFATFAWYALMAAGAVWTAWCVCTGQWGLACWLVLSGIASLLGMGLAGLIVMVAGLILIPTAWIIRGVIGLVLWPFRAILGR